VNRSAFLAVLLAGCAAAQTASLPPDIDAKSNSRLPLIQRDQMSPEGQHVFDQVVPKDKEGNQHARPGATALSLYSPGVAGPLDEMHSYLANKSVIGTATFQICSLIASREFDDSYDWNAHEGQALKAMVDPKTLDAIRYNRPLDGLPEKEALVVAFGRALFRDRKVSTELYQKVVATFGKQGMIEIASTFGTYSFVALMMRSVDQRPANPTYQMPAIQH
jgi:4-carboxymuconolactone decarboxylase